MPISAAAVFEIRASATAGNVNGGGFVTGASGTDYSQQDAAQYALTGVTSGGAGDTVLTASAAADMVGNIGHGISGTNLNAGWYEVLSVVVGVSITFGTNQAGASICSGAVSSGVINIGGAMSLNSTLDDEFFEIGQPGNKFWIRLAAGTVSLGEAVAIGAAGGASNPIVIEGYNTSRGDGSTAANRAVIAQTTRAFTLGVNWDIRNIITTGTASPMFTMGIASKMLNCKMTNTSASANQITVNVAADCFLFNNELISYRGIALNSAFSFHAYGNYIHDSNIGWLDTSTSSVVTFAQNIVENCVTANIRLSAAHAASVQIAGNTLFGTTNTTGIGVDLATGCTDIRIFNNIISGFVSGVVHADVQSVGFDDYNDYSNNDTDVTGWTKGAHDVTTAPAFTNVTQITGTTGAFTAGNDRIVDTSKNFTALGVVANQDHIYIISGTGVTAGIYAITAIATTTNPNDTLVLTPAPGTSTVADKVYQLTVGHNFLPTGAI